MDTDHLSEQQREWYEKLAGLGEELSADHLVDDATEEFCPRKWRTLADTGLFELPIREGEKPDGRLLTTLAALEGLGYGCRDSGLSFSAATHMASTGLPVFRFGSAALRERYLPGVRTGESIGAHAITEAEAGSDALAMGATAEPDGDEYVLNGHKVFISNAPIADQVVVYARTGPAGTAASVTAFVVDADTAGLTLGEPVSTMGLRTSPLGEVRLEDVRVPRERMLGHPGGGFLILGHVMSREILCVSAIQIGEMRYRLERCLEYATERHQFGRPIGSYQAVSHSLVEMRLGLETACRWLHDTARRMVDRKDTTFEVAATKLATSEANSASARKAMQIFGGRGYLTESGIERMVRDSLSGTVYSGTSETQRNRIAALMGLPGQ
ncbi:acyl-CoA dehydrogenase family protein [Actinopolyspora mortivallis]|uniref:acyl-CoA dehydrogenase family protein n=1 Tax=Actinopolyspora mortivallis TaxID=33906 RepID=UPI0003694567|nr:acyl-CoA dehydrogenase family protein [Actinopolyspora mortivallis]